jgi:hypothetical protein
MSTTRHILNHPAGTIEIELDESSGEFDLRFPTPLLNDASLKADVHRWVGAIGRGWARRNSNGSAKAVKISTQIAKGKFTMEG